MKCTLQNKDDLIASYLMHELSEEKAKEFEEHFFQCNDCFNDLRLAEKTFNVIREHGARVSENPRTDKKHFSPGILNRLFPSIPAPVRFGLAGAAIIIIILLLLYTPTGNDVTVEDSIITERPLAELTGPAFDPDPYMEEWIAERLRSGEEIIDTVFAPQNDTIIHEDDVLFRWSMHRSADVLLRVMTNYDEVISSSDIQPDRSGDVRYTIQAEVFPGPGLYYWRIEDAYEVHYVGKFYFLRDR